MKRLRAIGAPRTLFVSTLGGLLAGAALPACRAEPEAPPLEEKGVRTVVAEVRPGQYVIEDEQVVDTLTSVVVRGLDGTTTRIADPAQFASMLAPPDSIAAFQTRAAADSVRGGGASWGDAPAAGTSGDAWGDASDRPAQAGGAAFSGGLPLGTLLFYTLAMNAWRPAAYAPYMGYGSPPRAYRSGSVRDSSRTRRRRYVGFVALGRAAGGYTDAVQRSSARARANRPTGGRSGYGRSTWGGRSSGG